MEQDRFAERRKTACSSAKAMEACGRCKKQELGLNCG